eukprot:TRINITY_DN14279_c0_g1_i1.p1 TRINITY_DN14279_c0_g1~~TRINITY_DN14279_c0_g1_i1.p1  ORF type:complete len:125 (-),score=20.98 TRINITY_DN14279_c0_g1_i1:50-424(-)
MMQRLVSLETALDRTPRSKKGDLSSLELAQQQLSAELARVQQSQSELDVRVSRTESTPHDIVAALREEIGAMQRCSGEKFGEFGESIDGLRGEVSELWARMMNAVNMLNDSRDNLTTTSRLTNL